MLQAGVDTLAGVAAHTIGENRNNLGYVPHKLLHAVTGTITSQLLANDPISGALGAVMGEILAEALVKDAHQRLPELYAEALERGEVPTQHSLNETYLKEVEKKADLVLVGTAFAALVAGQDVNLAHRTAETALHHNFIRYIMSGLAAAWPVLKRTVLKRLLRKELVKRKLPANLKKGDWIPSEKALEKVPDFLGKGIKNKKEPGFRWFGKHGANSIRIDKGNPKADFPHQRVDHVRINVDGKIMSRDGSLLPGGTKTDIPEVHIPLSEWMEWKAWNIK